MVCVHQHVQPRFPKYFKLPVVIFGNAFVVESERGVHKGAQSPDDHLIDFP